MITLFLDGDLYTQGSELHAALKKMLSLPEYYGMNADALNDCISSMRETVNVHIVSRGNEAVSRVLDLVCRVIEDNGGQVKEL